MRQRERNGDQPGLHGPQERQNVVEALRSQDRRPVSDSPVQTNLACHVDGPAGQLRPRNALGNARPVLFVVGEGERDVVGAQAGASVQHGED